MAADFVSQNGFLCIDSKSESNSTLNLSSNPEDMPIVQNNLKSELECGGIVKSSRASGKPHKMSGRLDINRRRSREILRGGLSGLVLIYKIIFYFLFVYLFFCYRLIIASKYDILSVLKESIILLKPSSPFAVHCEFMEPLTECYLYLQQSGMAIRMQLFDTWKREFQTLPGRIHPEMKMQTSGGYILSGIFVSCHIGYYEPLPDVADL